MKVSLGETWCRQYEAKMRTFGTPVETVNITTKKRAKPKKYVHPELAELDGIEMTVAHYQLYTIYRGEEPDDVEKIKFTGMSLEDQKAYCTSLIELIMLRKQITPDN